MVANRNESDDLERLSSKEQENIGKIISIDGPVIGCVGLRGQKIGDLVKIGHKKLIGEIIKIIGDITITQCYDNTDGLEIEEPVVNTGYPLSMELAPGLLNTIFDGIQRPLSSLVEIMGGFIETGAEVDALDRKKKWLFKPLVKAGIKVSGGDIIGEVQETRAISHKIMVPLNVSGELAYIADEGKYTITEGIFEIKKEGIKKSYPMLQRWPIRQARPYKKRIYPTEPLVTGMRVIDLLYPIAKGGAVAVPGGFGTGKTVIQHNLAKWADADIVVYVGCGERGNEMADILEEFPTLEDPKTGLPLMERTVLIGNTSNMPVSAREASIFSGLTIAEYFRDMGYHVALMADSTSRWAEALRELSGRLEEMPAEGGYPAYLATKLSGFYERGGYVNSYGAPDRFGSISLIGAVSPPSGDFSEPVTKTTKRFVRGFWALDARLAYARHYPAISWVDSYSQYGEYLKDWWDEHVEPGWASARIKVGDILTKSDQLQNIVQLVGKENLPLDQQLMLYISDLIKQTYLIQNAFDEVDRYSAPAKSLKLIKLILLLYEKGLDLIKFAVPIYKIQDMEVINDIIRARFEIKNDEIEKLDELKEKLLEEYEEILKEYQNMI
ncbi:MAG: V-type ATP synthase subunit A [Promethearchaeota archaeon]